MRLVMYMLAICGLLTLAACGSTVTVTGQVSSKPARVPLPNATVSLGGQTTTTDAAGYFTFDKVGTGWSKVSVVAAGYTPASQVFCVQKGDNTLDFALEEPSYSTPYWRHSLQIVANLRASPPSVPLILILGSSTAREMTISDASLTAAIEKRSGRRVVAHNIASSNEGFTMDAALVPFIPRAQAIVLIDVHLGRFTQPRATVRVDLPAPAPAPAYEQHRYSASAIKNLSEKRALLARASKLIPPEFKAHYRDDLAALEQVLAACKQHGLHAVLLDTPRNTAVIGDALSDPIKTYEAGCAALAADYGIPFVKVVNQAHFPNGDFYDLYHLVEPGRAKLQGPLSASIAQLVARYFPAN